jgi:hypothetical protein
MFEKAQNDAYRVGGFSRALPAMSADRNALCAQRDKGSEVCLATMRWDERNAKDKMKREQRHLQARTPHTHIPCLTGQLCAHPSQRLRESSSSS